MSQREPPGNTDTGASDKKKEQTYQRYRWVFTMKEESSPDEGALWDVLSQIAKKFTFQLEVGEGGFRHYQGVISLYQKHRLQEVKNLIGCNTVHLEDCKNWYAACKYASKEDTREKGPWTEKTRPVKILEKKMLHKWQADLEEELLTEPEDRKIIWYHDYAGGNGKTSFCKYMAVKHGACIITSGRVSDIAYIVKNHIPKIIIFNITRSLEDHVNYQAIESCKDGIITSTKYDSNTLIFNSPHVVIMANFEARKEMLSKDRWDIRIL